MLWPLEVVFKAAAALRRVAYRRGWVNASKPPVPVVVVGNIAVGGTGKTPVTIALCAALRAAGWQPGIASRGYGSRAGTYPRLVTSTTSVQESGDEPLLLARRTGCPVVIDPRRARAAERLHQDHGCDVIVCDDGLQHYALARDIEWVVVDGARGLGNGHCLPVGPLREPPSRLNAADAVLVNGPGFTAPGAMRFSLQTTHLQPLAGGPPTTPADFASRWSRVHAVAGIGNPERFFASLRGLGLEVIEHPYPDHHRFAAADLQFGDGLPVVMTEKDAVKCQTLALRDCWYLPVTAQLPDSAVHALIATLGAPRFFGGAVRFDQD